MRCHECGGALVQKSGRLQFTDQFAGPFTVRSVEYSECEKCGDRLFSPHAARQIEEARERTLQDVLQSQPISAFVSRAEAATILGISRQALHKHRRIRRGFIFRTRFGDTTVYLRKSVDLFKATGDGRFLLRESERIEHAPEMEQVFRYDVSFVGNMIRLARAFTGQVQLRFESQPQGIPWRLPPLREAVLERLWDVLNNKDKKVYGKAEKAPIQSPGNLNPVAA